MSNLIGPLLGHILPYCTGMGGYCTVWVVVMETSNGKKICSASWHAWSDLWGWLSNSAWFCLVSVACETRFCLLQGTLCSLYSSEILTLDAASHEGASASWLLWSASCGLFWYKAMELVVQLNLYLYKPNYLLFTQAAWLTMCGSYFIAHPVM